MKPTIKELSKLTGLSPATVSNALNKKQGVNRDTAKRVLQIAEEIGYLNTEKIRKIKLVMYKTNGQITDDTPFFPMMLDGFQNECKKCGYEVVVIYLDRRAPDFAAQVEDLIGDSASVVALLGSELREKDFVYFKNARCMFLTLDYWNRDMRFPGVLSNNEDAVVMAVKYLYRKGHREIGYLKSNFRIQPFSLRGAGYEFALASCGLEYQKKFIVSLTPIMEESYRDLKAYLEKKPELPTAFFADNDMIALGAMKAFQECGYRIPEDISVIGFDDLPFCEIVSPRLTSMRVPKQEMGQIAVRKLVNMIELGETVVTKTQVCAKFIERDSVMDLSGGKNDKNQIRLRAHEKKYIQCT